MMMKIRFEFVRVNLWYFISLQMCYEISIMRRLCLADYQLR